MIMIIIMKSEDEDARLAQRSLLVNAVSTNAKISELLLSGPVFSSLLRDFYCCHVFSRVYDTSLSFYFHFDVVININEL